MNFRFAVLFLVFVYASELFANSPVMLWVEFTDKNHSSYSISRPEEFLTQRAIERRLKQRIPVDHYDLPVSEHYVQSLTSQTGVEIRYKSKWMNGALLALDNAELIDVVGELDFIKRSELVIPLESTRNQNSGNAAARNVTRTDSMSFNPETMINSTVTWNPYPDYGNARNQIEMVNGHMVHNMGFWGDDIVVAVLDSGFSNVDSLEAFNHLWNTGKILGYKDFVTPGGDVFRSHSHGTMVLGVMAALVDNQIAGASLGASYWLLRTEQTTYEYRIEEYNWLAGVEFADSVGADIINSSLGYTVFDYTPHSYTYDDLDGQTTVVARAANKAFSRGMLVVNSAGNAGNQRWKYLGSPADASGVLAVGATDNTGERASFSSVGPTADRRVKPDVTAQGRAVATVNPSGNLVNANGTSFSSPLIAAMAACLWQAFPDASNSEIKHAIISSSDRYLQPDSLYGHGIPDFQKAYEILRQSKKPRYFVSLGSNPLQPGSTLILQTDDDQSISIEFINSNGQRIWYINNIRLRAGQNEIKPFGQVDQLASGIYFIRMNFKDRSELIKAIKM